VATDQDSHRVINGYNSSGDEAISSLIEKIFKTQSLNVSLIDEFRTVPDFQVTFRHLLRERLKRKDFLEPTILGQLLGIAFEAQQHLDWVLFKGLPTDAIMAALEMPELKEAQSICLCIDTIHGTHKQLLESLSMSTSLRELYLFQEPTRESDNSSAQLFLELLSTSHLHLLKCKIVLSGPFSSSLSKRFWLPTSWKINAEAFPVQHMFVRRQFKTGGNPVFSPEHFYLGDALLRPERFAAGFLQFLQSLITGETMMDTQLYSFACAPSTLTEMSSKEVSPIPVENSTIPKRPIKRDFERRFLAGLLTDLGNEAVLPVCWPKVRDIIVGSWVVLVSKNWYYDLEAIKTLDHNTFPLPSVQACFIRYAFVRPKANISVENYLENLKPEAIEVCGLKEFLQATAPEVDQDLVDHRLKELEAYISNAPEQIPLGPGLEWVSVLEPHEACVVLRDFSEDAEYVKGNLRLAMEDDPEGRLFIPSTILF
jgi:hypothetical protein